MKKGRVTYLFGAGAVIPWGGPLTDDITKEILGRGFFCVDNKTRVTQKIHTILINGGFTEEEINFETIMNIIEELIVLKGSKNYNSPSSFINPFVKFTLDCQEIFNFRVKDQVQRGFQIKIPRFEFESSKIANRNQSPEQFYLQLLYDHLLFTIEDLIIGYSYHSTDKSNILTDENDDLNKSFTEWIINKINNNNVARLYTLNYDSLFSVLLKDKDISIFEGADFSGEIKDPVEIDILKIINSSTNHCHYNLHGNINWKIQTTNWHNLPSISYTICQFPNFNINESDRLTTQIEQGKIIYPKNIITGYQKAQKSFISPFKQIQSSFERDAMSSNKIYIVGYSFGDQHLNEVIKNVIKFRPETVIEIIDPNFRDEKIDLSIFSNSKQLSFRTNIDENTSSYLDGKVIVKRMKFDEYLKNVI